MNYRILARITCRIMAISLFVKFVSLFSLIIYPAMEMFNAAGRANEAYAANILPMAFSGLILLILSIILWFFADGIAKLLIGKADEISENTTIDMDKFQVAAFTIVGVLLITLSIPNLVRLATQMNMMVAQKAAGSMAKIIINSRGQLYGFIVQLLLGLWLSLGAQGIVKAIQSLRDIGVKTEDDRNSI